MTMNWDRFGCRFNCRFCTFVLLLNSDSIRMAAAFGLWIATYAIWKINKNKKILIWYFSFHFQVCIRVENSASTNIQRKHIHNVFASLDPSPTHLSRHPSGMNSFSFEERKFIVEHENVVIYVKCEVKQRSNYAAKQSPESRDSRHSGDVLVSSSNGIDEI